MNFLKRYRSKPDFIVIGAGRSGTTWIYENLRRCDSVWLPPVKELHYFDRNPKYPSPSHLFNEKIWERLFGCESYNREFRIKMVRSLGKQILKFNLSNLIWCFKYYFGYYSDNWYISLFNNKRKITGDITPAYQLLNLKDVSHVNKLLPNAKIVFIIRNPIFRTWSQLRKNRQVKLNVGKIKEVLNSDDVKLRNDYLYTLKNWSKFYPASQIKLFFFDDIVNCPERILKELFDFILKKKCDCKIHSQKNQFQKKVNSGPVADLDDEIKKLIVREAYPNLKKLCEEIGGYPCEWFKNAQEFLSTSKNII